MLLVAVFVKIHILTIIISSIIYYILIESMFIVYES